MSDGPHKSLPMRPGWKRFAERADLAAFDCDQVAELAIPALQDDWNDEVAPHIDALRNVLFEDRQGLLSGAQDTAELEQLKRLSPGNTLWRAVIDNVAQSVANGLTGPQALEKGGTDALVDRAGRGAVQVEEHYLRRTGDEQRATDVRARLDEGFARASIEGMARRVLGLESGNGPGQPQKLQGLDDGVR